MVGNNIKKNNSQSKKARPITSVEKVLAVLFGVAFILGFLLTPLGFETRFHEIRTLAFGGFFITVGLLIPLIGLVSLYLRKPRLAGVLAVIAASLNFLTPPADQALFFFTVSPPLAVTIGEFILIFIGIGYILYGPRVYAGDQTPATNFSQEPKE